MLRYDREELITDPRSYLFKVAANVASEWSMRASQRLPHSSNWLDLLTDESDLIDEVERAQRDRELRSALDQLPPRAREVLRLHFGEGLGYEAIARRLEVTQRVVKREIVNAYGRLRVALADLRVRSGSAAECRAEAPTRQP